MSDWNVKIIEEFRANGGRVENFGDHLVLLHTTGAKSGQVRVHPLAFQPDGDRIVVFASKAGAPTNPDWYHNVLANPQVKVETGSETYDAVARVAEGDERERLWARQKELMPGFADYEKATTRQIPVVILERVQ